MLARDFLLKTHPDKGGTGGKQLQDAIRKYKAYKKQKRTISNSLKEEKVVPSTPGNRPSRTSTHSGNRPSRTPTHPGNRPPRTPTHPGNHPPRTSANYYCPPSTSANCYTHSSGVVKQQSNIPCICLITILLSVVITFISSLLYLLYLCTNIIMFKN